jgi:hypothetical protein
MAVRSGRRVLTILLMDRPVRASPRRYDDTAVKVSHLHSDQQRLVALDVGDPQLVR